MISFPERRREASAPADPPRGLPARGDRPPGATREGPAWPWLGGWAGLIAVAFGAGVALRAGGALPVDALPPLHAHARLVIIPLLPAVVVALAGAVVLPIAARRLPWRRLLGTTWLASMAWAVTLQLPDGISRPLTAPPEYLSGLRAIGDHPLAWLRGFTRHLPEYPTHVKGHPPLPMVILWTMRWIGLGGASWAAALVIAVGASSAAAIMITVRALAGEDRARRTAAFLVLSPTAICLATSMDALFLGASAWGTALLTMAVTSCPVGSPRPPWGAIPFLSSRAVDQGDKGFHNLWITFRIVPFRAGAGPVAARYPAFRHLRVSSATHRSPAYIPVGPAASPGSAPTPVPSSAASPSSAVSASSAASPPSSALPLRVSSHPGLASSATLRALPGGSRGNVVLAVAAGVLAGSLPFLSYGLLSIFVLPLAVLILMRPKRSVVLAMALGFPAVPVAFASAGFFWWDGVIATHAAWAAGAGARRPYAYFLVGDLAVLALIIGPVAAVALPHALRHASAAVRATLTRRKHVRGRARSGSDGTARLGILAGAALAGVIALDVSGVTRGEVERIWLPYAAWMTVGTAVHRAPARRLLLAQAGTALLIEALVRSPW